MLAFVLAFCFASCNQNKIETSNTIENVNAIFEQPEFSIEINLWGCAGSNYYNLDLSKQETNYKMESRERKVATTLSHEKIDSLKLHCINLLNDKEKLDWCSSGVSYIIGKKPNYIGYTRYCTQLDPIGDLLDYIDLIIDMDSFNIFYDSLMLLPIDTMMNWDDSIDYY